MAGWGVQVLEGGAGVGQVQELNKIPQGVNGSESGQVVVCVLVGYHSEGSRGDALRTAVENVSTWSG